MSERYQKMCDCPEIQKGHRWEEGDKVYDGDQVFYHGYGDNMPTAFEYGTSEETYIWLPSQEQIQGMLPPFVMQIYHKKLGEMQLIDYAHTNILEVLMELFMGTVHDKAWDDEKGWVKT